MGGRGRDARIVKETWGVPIVAKCKFNKLPPGGGAVMLRGHEVIEPRLRKGFELSVGFRCGGSTASYDTRRRFTV